MEINPYAGAAAIVMEVQFTHWGRVKMAVNFSGNIFKYIFLSENYINSIKFH